MTSFFLPLDQNCRVGITARLDGGTIIQNQKPVKSEIAPSYTRSYLHSKTLLYLYSCGRSSNGHGLNEFLASTTHVLQALVSLP